MRTLRTDVETEIPKVKGSRFLGFAGPVRDGAEAAARVEAVRAQHRKATHVASAWRAAGEEGASDDGEVSGTAGQPILSRIRGAELDDVVVIVVRYYGGTLLGKGGLVRAYGQTAAAVLDAAEVLEVEDTVDRTFRVSLAVGAAVQAAVLRAGFEVVDVLWGADVRYQVRGAEEGLTALERAVTDAARGDVRFQD